MSAKSGDSEKETDLIKREEKTVSFWDSEREGKKDTYPHIKSK